MAMRKLWCVAAAVVVASGFQMVHAQDAQQALQIGLQHIGEQRHIIPTRFTADHTDIVKAGTVLILHKPALVMFSVEYMPQATSQYQNGKLSMGFGTSMEAIKTGDNRVPQRTFVDGEKMWFAGSEVADGAVFVLVISDPFNDVRYQTKLKFPFNKKSPPTAEDMMKTISEVVTADTGSDQDATQQAQAPAPPAAPPAPAVTAPIAPPPPPVDAPPAQPKTIAIGQSPDVVVAILGQPDKRVELGTKTLFIYKDLKVTFVKGKVSDVQ